eukprot:3905879-Amphidinium_carterae.1
MLALVVALQVWGPLLQPSGPFQLESDSKAALDVALALGARSPSTNALAVEIEFGILVETHGVVFHLNFCSFACHAECSSGCVVKVDSKS